MNQILNINNQTKSVDRYLSLNFVSFPCCSTSFASSSLFFLSELEYPFCSLVFFFLVFCCSKFLSKLIYFFSLTLSLVLNSNSSNISNYSSFTGLQFLVENFSTFSGVFSYFPFSLNIFLIFSWIPWLLSLISSPMHLTISLKFLHSFFLYFPP